MCSPSNLHKSPRPLITEMPNLLRCKHLPFCRIDQPASDADSSRQPRQIFKIFHVEPLRVFDFRSVDANFAAAIVREERDHERMRERPRLTGEVAHVTYPDPDLFIYLALQALLQGLTRFDETSQGAIHILGEPRRARQEKLLSTPHQPHHCGGEPGIRHQPATRALSAALACPRGRCPPACTAVLVRAVPIDDLQRPSGERKLRFIEHTE